MPFLLILLVLGVACPGAADQGARQFIAAVAAYQLGDYETAIADFSDLAESGVTNPKLYYNLGNAYLKHGDLGRALLWYEKAADLIPNDPDLRFNLAYARSLTIDADAAPAGSLVRIFFFWRYQLSAATIVMVAVICNLIFWVLAGAYRLTRRPVLKTLALVVLVPTLVFALTAGFNFYAAKRLQQAIVLPDRISVRAGLEDTATALFDLHAGAKVSIIKHFKEHYQIRYSEDKLGWVPKESLGLL
jgi:tetratricopeptide (TPR) repeat protein